MEHFSNSCYKVLHTGSKISHFMTSYKIIRFQKKTDISKGKNRKRKTKRYVESDPDHHKFSI